MPEVLSDGDLPQFLNTRDKQIEWIRTLVARNLGSTVANVQDPPWQGLFSRTRFVTTTDDKQIVIQFRTEQQDLQAFDIAKKALGHVVPDISVLQSDELEAQGVWAYCSTLMPGTPLWQDSIAGNAVPGLTTVAESLGQIFSKGYLEGNSRTAVETVIKPHLTALLASSKDEVQPFKDVIQSYLEKADSFAALPLWVTHHDINDANTLIDDECRITGLIDWELSKPLPFAVGLGRIHTIAGRYRNRVFVVPDWFEDVERAFWTALFDGMPAQIRVELEDQKELVQDAVLLATLSDVFPYIEGIVYAGEAGPKALPKLLTYRMPLVRGSEPPYRI